MEILPIFLGLLPSIPFVLAWLVALIFAVRMVRNNGGKPEHSLLIGVSFMLAGSVIGCAMSGLIPWLITTEMENQTIAMIYSIVNLVGSLISLVGIIFLLYAFWQKFHLKKTLT